MTARTALVTGAAGFIGYHVCAALLDRGWTVRGVDGMTDYYDPALKRARLAQLATKSGFTFTEAMIETPGILDALMASDTPRVVIHLAAQAGVRYSIDAPESYATSNLMGTFRVLEAARAHPPEHLLLASTSSVYGANTDRPYAEIHKADHPMSFYAATKKANEAMAHSYAHLYGLPTTLFRFFTVYGPWGRPDMALFKFTRAAFAGDPIEVYNEGRMKRDFTYIDDLVDALVSLIDAVPGDAPVGAADSLSPVAPCRIVNIGSDAPTGLMDFIKAVETATGKQIAKTLLPMQPGDVPETWADTTLLDTLIGARQRTPLSDGVARFVAWYRDYHGV